MIDLDKITAGCLILLAGGFLVLSSYVVVTHRVDADIGRWRELTASSQATAERCVSVIEGIAPELVRSR
tara:strand:- start:319 stop:525 length:207 start_codon:yes stop_codon:yes gene_type:complete